MLTLLADLSSCGFWENRLWPLGEHSAAAQDGSWTTGEVAPGKSATLKFDKPGSYTYSCADHPWSYAQIVVE